VKLTGWYEFDVRGDDGRLFTIVASVALVISWAAPLAVYFANAFPGTNASRIVGLMSLHAIAGVVTIAVLRTYGTAVR